MAKKNDGIRKAAILLIALGPDTSSQILKRLPNNLIQKVTYEIANIDYVEPHEKNEILQNFIDTVSARQYVLDGGFDYAKNLLNMATAFDSSSPMLITDDKNIIIKVNQAFCKILHSHIYFGYSSLLEYRSSR